MNKSDVQRIIDDLSVTVSRKSDPLYIVSLVDMPQLQELEKAWGNPTTPLSMI